MADFVLEDIERFFTTNGNFNSFLMLGVNTDPYFSKSNNHQYFNKRLPHL